MLWANYSKIAKKCIKPKTEMDTASFLYLTNLTKQK